MNSGAPEYLRRALEDGRVLELRGSHSGDVFVCPGGMPTLKRTSSGDRDRSDMRTSSRGPLLL